MSYCSSARDIPLTVPVLHASLFRTVFVSCLLLLSPFSVFSLSDGQHTVVSSSNLASLSYDSACRCFVSASKDVDSAIAIAESSLLSTISDAKSSQI